MKSGSTSGSSSADTPTAPKGSTSGQAAPASHK
jgi:hypothetical protein